MFQIPFSLCIYGFAMGALICRLSQVLMNPHAPPWRRHCPARPYACTIINFINARIHARTNAAQIDCNFACMYNDRCRPRTMQRGGVYWDELLGRVTGTSYRAAGFRDARRFRENTVHTLYWLACHAAAPSRHQTRAILLTIIRCQ